MTTRGTTGNRSDGREGGKRRGKTKREGRGSARAHALLAYGRGGESGRRQPCTTYLHFSAALLPELEQQGVKSCGGVRVSKHIHLTSLVWLLTIERHERVRVGTKYTNLIAYIVFILSVNVFSNKCGKLKFCQVVQICPYMFYRY